MTRLNMPNRRIRGRMYGGVGGEVSNGLPYPMLVEVYFRRRLNPKISVFILFIGLLLVGAFGKLIENNKGYPQRLDAFLAQNKRGFSQIGSAGKVLETQSCRRVFQGLDKGLCVYEGEGEPTVVLFGDSHALQYYKGLKKSLPNEKVAMIGGGWGGKFLGPLNPISKDRDIGFSKEVYDQLERHSNIHTVVISHYPHQDSVKDFIDTFDFFSRIGKRIIYVIDIPRIDFDPKKCFDSRPFRLFARTEFTCSTPKQVALKPLASYRDNALKALKERPNVQYMDTADILCTEETCFAMKDDKLLYSSGGINPNPLNLRKTGHLGLAPGPEFGSIFTVDS